MKVSKTLSPSRAYLFKRSYQGGSILNNQVGNVSGGLAFQLADLPNASEFTNLFDQYMICGVKIKFIPQCDTLQALTTGATSNFCGTFFYVIDYDDANAPLSTNSICEYQNTKTRNPLREFKTYFRPKPVSTVFGAGVTVNAGTLKSQWLDVAQPSVPHFGFKYFWTQSIGANISLMPVLTYYIKCKNVR